jgi:hypothetical protein
MWRHAVGQVEHKLIDIAPTPTVRRIITLDYRVPGDVEVLCGVLVGRIIATPDMSAGATDAEMDPYIAGFEAFFATERTWRNLANVRHMLAVCCHLAFSSLIRPGKALKLFPSPICSMPWTGPEKIPGVKAP